MTHPQFLVSKSKEPHFFDRGYAFHTMSKLDFARGYGPLFPSFAPPFETASFLTADATPSYILVCNAGVDHVTSYSLPP